MGEGNKAVKVVIDDPAAIKRGRLELEKINAEKQRKNEEQARRSAK